MCQKSSLEVVIDVFIVNMTEAVIRLSTNICKNKKLLKRKGIRKGEENKYSGSSEFLFLGGQIRGS